MTDRTERELAARALVRATDDLAPDVERLVAAVPRMLGEAERRRSVRASALVASIPYARRAIPRLAAAAALLVILSAVLSWGGRAAPRATANESFAELLIAGSELGGDPWFESLTGAEDSR